MIEPTALAGILKSLVAYSKEQDDRKRATRATAILVLDEVYAAVLATENYIARLRRSSAPNPDREMELANLWIASVSRLRGIDRALSKRCFKKGDYWADSEGWQGSEWDEIALNLQTVRSECERLRAKHDDS
jgi:hypothetical protein